MGLLLLALNTFNTFFLTLNNCQVPVSLNLKSWKKSDKLFLRILLMTLNMYMYFFRDYCHISFLILSEFKRIN